MELKIQSIHFDATEKLQAYIEKKVDKFGKWDEEIVAVEVVLKIVKPETANNKEVSMKILVANGELFVDKTSDTFEEAVSDCIEALRCQMAKYKEKQRIF